MNGKDIANLSTELIIKYYENDPKPFLNHMDNNAMWFGPAKGQFIKGSINMKYAWDKEEHNLKFSLGNVKVQTASSHPSFCEVMLLYSVVTHYPDGHEISVDQRLHLSWGERVTTDNKGKKIKKPRILLCHISNPHDKHDEDLIYPRNYSQVYAGSDAMPQKGKRIHFRGKDRSEYYFLSDSIYWIETAHGAKHSILHTTKGTLEVISSISAIANQFEDLFIRCHQSFLVNPHYIKNVRRFQVTLVDDTIIPIAEKRYTTFRRQLEH